MKGFSFRIFGFWLILFNTILYFIFHHEKGVSTGPQLFLILVGLVCFLGSFIPFKKKG